MEEEMTRFGTPEEINRLMPRIYNEQIKNIPEYMADILAPYVEGNYSGVFANKSFEPGDLILVRKAFAVYNDELTLDEVPSISCPLETNHPLKIGLVNEVCKKLSNQPGLCSSFFHNYSWRERSWGKGPCPYTAEDKEEIQKVVNCNDFPFLTSVKYPTTPEGLHRVSLGIWPHEMSLINHRCTPNSFWMVFGGHTIFLRAVRRIDKDEQIFISYLNTSSTSVRQSLFEKRSIICDCNLCKFGVLNPSALDDNCKAISDVFKEFMKPMYRRPVINQEQLEVLREHINNLEKIKKSDDLFSYYIADEVANEDPEKDSDIFKFVDALLISGYHQLYFDYFRIAYEALETVKFKAVQTASFSGLNLRCYLSVKSKDRVVNAKPWVDKMKTDLKIAFGNTQMIQHLYPPLYNLVVQNGLRKEFFP